MRRVTCRFVDKAKTLVADKRLIRRRYLCGWFAFDLVSSIPVQILVLIDRETFQDLVALKLIRLLKLGRLSRVGRIKFIKDLSYSGQIPPGIVRLIKLLLVYFFVTHVISCLYWTIAYRELADCGGSLIDVLNWGICAELRDEAPWTEQYSHSFYWSLLVMMGNDSFPISHADRSFTILVVLVGMMVNSVVIGSCASLLANLDTSAVQKQQQFDAINENLSYHRVNSQLAKKVPQFTGAPCTS